MNLAKCQNCGKKIPIHMRKNAKYCCDTCRKEMWDYYHERRAYKRRKKGED